MYFVSFVQSYKFDFARRSCNRKALECTGTDSRDAVKRQVDSFAESRLAEYSFIRDRNLHFRGIEIDNQ